MTSQDFDLSEYPLPYPETKASRSLRAGFAVLAVFLLLAFAAGFAASWTIDRTQPPPAAAAGAAQTWPSFKVFWEAQDILQRDFLGKPPLEADRTYGAIKGVLQTYRDPYTIFVEPQPRTLERDRLRGRFGGIGVRLTISDTGQVFLLPLPGRPADKAGLQANDELLAVNGQPVAGKSVDEVTVLLRGDVGSQITLQLRRAGVAAPFDVTLTLAEIDDPSLDWRLLESDPSIGYIALHIFSERSKAELQQALTDLTSHGATRLILDLRHNPGGLLESAVDVASQFMASGVVLTERRANDATQVYEVRGDGLARAIPLVVLTDEATASAAEIVAGALQDSGRAPLVGRKTYGKGSVQLVYDLSDGSSLHVTVARWLTPAGHQIDGTGLTPDQVVETSDTADGSDAILQAGVARLAQPPF